MVTSIVITVIALIVTYRIVKNDNYRHLPTKLKVTLIGFILCNLLCSFEWAYATFVIRDKDEFRALITCLSLSIFLINHWLFTSQYVSVAFLV